MFLYAYELHLNNHRVFLFLPESHSSPSARYIYYLILDNAHAILVAQKTTYIFKDVTISYTHYFRHIGACFAVSITLMFHV